ncbi:MAG: right-handed parallel beta-helix repeat-containing protein [Eubacteriales bacterium]|jgi:hypothetical protein
MTVHVALYPVQVPTSERVCRSFDEAIAVLRQHQGVRELVVHGGTYPATSIRLTEEDSRLTIRAAGSERPVLSGAVTVGGWHKDAATGWFYTHAPVHDFRLLITADGRYLKKARYPLEGALSHRTIFTAAQWVGSHAGGWQRALLDEELNHFEYNPADIPAEFDAVSAELQVYHSWNESYCKIAHWDKDAHTFWLTPNCTYPPGVWKRSYAVYNTREGMGEDGRWYCDRNTDTIWYRPLPGETPEDFLCYVPVTTRVISIDGARDVILRGLTLTAATTPVVNEPYLYPCQRGGAGFGVMEQDGAVTGTGLENCTIEDCEITLTGGYGLMLRGEGLHVRRCRIHQCGAGGIGISSENLITLETRDDPKWSCVEDCDISRIGLDYYGAAGIFSNSAMLRRNRVADTPYTNIIANGDYCVVEDNICVDPMRKLNDGGCIYMHINVGCIVRRNICITHNTPDRDNQLVWGLYLDSQTEGYEMYGNYVRGFRWPMADARRGGRNDWHDNIFEYDGPETMRIRFPADKEMRFHKNILRSRKIEIVANPEYYKRDRDLTGNVFVCDDVTLHDLTAGERITEDATAYDLGDKNTRAPYAR